MKRDGFFAVFVSNEKIQRNGFLLAEILIAMMLSLILLVAIIPVLTQTIRQDRVGAVREELWRQGMVMDETIYHELRYATVTAVYEDQISFRDKDGKSGGFRVRGNTVYRMLSNQTLQPLTGSNRTVSGRGWIEAKPYGNEPYFKQVGEAIQMALILEDSATKEQWPCVLVVVPWKGEEQQDGPT